MYLQCTGSYNASEDWTIRSYRAKISQQILDRFGYWRTMNSGEQRCWICNAPADSAEHRLKKADLVRAYGKGPYMGPSAPVHVRSGVLSQVQGPGSSKVKYDAYLCHACNTAGTQPFDNAYDQVIEWVMANEPEVLRTRLLNFEKIYGPSYAEHQNNLFKYFVKSFGCRLVEAGQKVPQDLIDLLPLTTFRTALKITFSVNEDVVLLHKQDRDGFIGKSGIGCLMSKADPAVIHGYFYNEYVSWFTVHCGTVSIPRGD
jgi:hypothetical protein